MLGNYSWLKRIVATCCLFLCALGLAGSDCCAQSQTDMNQGAAKEYTKADAELNQVYKRIKSEYKDNAIFLKRLQAVQSAWVAFREAELEALYPTANGSKDDKDDTYGSAYDLCRYTWLTRLTAQRTKELKRWLIGVKEGDVCCGSVKVK